MRLLNRALPATVCVVVWLTGLLSPAVALARDGVRLHSAIFVFDGAFLPDGGDVGNVARFKIEEYRDPAPAAYR
jgi:hypothetical protein